jgi:hypothetical protein
MSTVHLQDNFIRIPVAEKVHACSQNKGDNHTLASSKKLAYQDYKNRHNSQQNRGSNLIYHKTTPSKNFGTKYLSL